MFEPPDGLRSMSETPASRFKRITHDTDKKREELLGWLEHNHITYSHVTVADALGTLFLNIPVDALPKVRTAPGVADVDIDTPIEFDLL
jgi:hypothetical protein